MVSLQKVLALLRKVCRHTKKGHTTVKSVVPIEKEVIPFKKVVAPFEKVAAPLVKVCHHSER